MVEGILVNGVVTAGVYALLAVGFSLIFGVARIMNLAHTAFYMLAAYFIFTFSHNLGLSFLLSIILSIPITTFIGICSYKLFIERIREHETTVLIMTIALAIAFQECMLLIFGGAFRGVPSFISGYLEPFGVRVSYQHLLTLGVILAILLGIWAFLSKSRMGIAIRSTSQDREIANLMGMDVGRICLITMAIAAALAAVAGAMVAPIFVLEPGMWMSPLITVLAVVVLGGLGSIKGSLIGAFILGFAETSIVFSLPTGAFLKTAASLTVMIVVLLVKPEGLFGVVFEEERL